MYGKLQPVFLATAFMILAIGHFATAGVIYEFTPNNPTDPSAIIEFASPPAKVNPSQNWFYEFQNGPSVVLSATFYNLPANLGFPSVFQPTGSVHIASTIVWDGLQQRFEDGEIDFTATPILTPTVLAVDDVLYPISAPMNDLIGIVFVNQTRTSYPGRWTFVGEAVPTPTSLVMLGLGLALIAGIRAMGARPRWSACWPARRPQCRSGSPIP
jgi:hypothetical protein